MQVIVADDHPLYREAVRLRLERLLPNAGITEVGSLDELLAQAREAPPFDLVLLDLYMPGTEPGPGVAAVLAAMQGVPIALMSGHASGDEVRQAIAAGARGFLPKTMSSDLFAMAISMILAGGTYLPAETLQTVRAGRSDNNGSMDDSALNGVLSPRERQVLVRLATGASNKEIGRELNLAEVTVKLHVRQILRKIKARNRSEAASMATRAGLI
jgi:two-component system, NarL family, nitrate/nitrite response regulator NarL